MQVMMGSEEAAFYLKSVGKKRKKLDARAFKALFKRQRIKEVLPDVDGNLEGPDNISRTCNGNGRVISFKPIGEGEDVSDECCKRFKGDSGHLSIDKASGGDLQKSTCNLRSADANIVENNLTVDSNLFDDAVGCSITKNTDSLKSGSADCTARMQHVDPAIFPVELMEHQRIQVSVPKGGPSTIPASNLTMFLRIDSISPDDAPNSVSSQSSFGAEVGTRESERFSSLSGQNNRDNFLRVEMRRLCQILKLSEDVTSGVGEFLEFVIKNHDVSSDSPAIMQAFQLSVCWIATLMSEQKVDKKDSFILAKKHLNYQCTEEQVYSVYSKMRPMKLMYLQSSENTFGSGKDCLPADDEDRSKEPSHIIDGAPVFSLFKQKDVKIVIKEMVQILLKKKLGMNVEAAGSEIHGKIKKIRKKCEKRMKKLVRKQEEEVQGLLRTLEEEKVKLEKDHKLESYLISCIHGQGLVRTSKLKLLDDNFAKKMEEHNLLKDMQLNYLKEKQLAAVNEERQKVAGWLAEAIAFARKVKTVNGALSIGFQSEDGAGCTKLSTHITQTGPENVVTMFQEESEDQNPSKNLYPQENNLAPSDTTIGAQAETADCDTSNMETFSSPNEVAVKYLEKPSETPDGQPNQLIHSCYTSEEIGSVSLPVCAQPASDEIRPVEMNQNGPTDLTTPVSDDHVDPVESSNTSNTGDQDPIGLPNTMVSHRDEHCESINSSFPFPGQPLVHSEKTLTFVARCGSLKQHVSQDEIHQIESAELEDRDTPAAEIQNTSQTEVATTELGDAVTLVQSNYVVSVTGNCEQLDHLSVDASLICNLSPPQEIEHQNRDQVTNISQTVVAGEMEELSQEIVSQSSENLHHNCLNLGQSGRISHEQCVELFGCSPADTVMAEAVRTTELQNQSCPQLGIDASHVHDPRNNDAEMTRSTCVQVSHDEIHRMESAELEDRDTPTAEIQNTSQTEVAAPELGDTVTLVQSNHAVPVTGNGEQLHQLSVDPSLICNLSPPREIEHQNRDQVKNHSQTVVGGEIEELSHEFVSQSSENVHHNQQNLGQASRISHEQSIELSDRSPDNTVMAEAVRTSELQNQSAPQLVIDAGHVHEPRNIDATRSSTCVQVSQDEIHQMASVELENRNTTAGEIHNTSETEILTLELGDSVTLVQSNHAVQITGNCEQLHHLSVDASLICNQSPPQEIEHQNGDQVKNFSQTIVTGETEELSHEFVSQSSENVHHNQQDRGQASRISHEQSVELSGRSPDHTVMVEAVSTTELPNQSVPELVTDAGDLHGPCHLLVHPSHQVTSWNSTPSLLAEPLQNELEKLRTEAEKLEKRHENAILQLKSDCDREIQEIINQIRTKYDMKLQDAEAEFRLKQSELEKNQNLVLMNTRLAEAFRIKYSPLIPSRPQGSQQVSSSSFVQNLLQPSLPPLVRVSPLTSASQPPPSQQISAPSAQALNQLCMPNSVRSSPVAIRNVGVSPPMQTIHRAGSVLSGTSTRPPAIASITPAANPRGADIRLRTPPHLQPFRPAAAPSMSPSSSPQLTPQLHPQPIYPPQLTPRLHPQPIDPPQLTPRTPPIPPLPQLAPNHLVSQNTPETQTGRPVHLNLSFPAIEYLRDMNHHVPLNHNLPPLYDVDSTGGLLQPPNFVTLDNVQGNRASSAVDTNIICLSDEE